MKSPFQSLSKAAFAAAIAVACFGGTSQSAYSQDAPPAADHSTMDHSKMDHSAMNNSDYMSHGEPSIVSEVRTADGSPLEIGKVKPMILSLKTKDKKPVQYEDLIEIHTERIHLLVVDPSLSDYQHIHPTPAEKIGEYKFDFAPRKSGKYIFYSDLLPKKTNAQEYSTASLTMAGTPEPVKKKENREITVEGYTFKLAFENPELVQGQSNLGSVTVLDKDGKPFDKLEPLMGAFAHLVGFSEDRAHVLHIHPQGKEPKSADERGGPTLNFYVVPNYPGYQELYAQVQINGKDVFAPFGMNIKARELPTDVAGIFKEVDANVAKLKNVIDMNQLSQVHGIAFWTRDVLAALSSAKDLPAEAKEKIAVPLKRIKTFADSLDRYGDTNDKPQSEAVFKRFEQEVESIRTLVGAKKAESTEDANVEVVGNKNCPVMHMPVGSMEPGAAIVYKGKKIGLCCNGCRATFNENPDMYLKNL